MLPQGITFPNNDSQSKNWNRASISDVQKSLAILEPFSNLKSLQRIAYVSWTSGIQYSVRNITLKKITGIYHINTWCSNNLLIFLLWPIGVKGCNIKRTVPLPMTLLLAEEALCLAHARVALFGLPRCSMLHLLFVLFLLPFLKGRMSCLRASHNIHRSFDKLVIFLVSLQ